MGADIKSFGREIPTVEDQHFVNIIATSLIEEGMEPDKEMCERWLRLGYVTEEELEQVLEAYEGRMGI